MSNEIKIEKLSDCVYCANCGSLSTQGMIVGDDGVVLVDTGVSADLASQILLEYRKITDKPIRAIIYTHGHPDHTMGAAGFVGDNLNIQIWARDNFNSEQKMFASVGLMDIFGLRAGRQFGYNLGPVSQDSNAMLAKAVAPTHFFSGERMSLDIISVPIELINTPGETSDQLAVWLPSKKVLFGGDTFIASFPNLYAVRGSGYRDVQAWSKSVKTLLACQAEYFVSGHATPYTGQKAIAQMLENYAKAIDFVFEKTIEGMNKGLRPQELVHSVVLPKELADLPYLKENYGNVSLSVRSIFAGFLGCFDGNPTNIKLLDPSVEAKNMVELVGGKDILLQKAQLAFAKQNYQWACQLVDNLLSLEPQNKFYRELKAQALSALAEQNTSSTVVNYYKCSAVELRK